MSESLTQQVSTLPLRQDDPFSMAILLKGMLITAILLAVVYVVLRLYAKRQGTAVRHAAGSDLHCVSALRLSSKTKVYQLKVGGKTVLVTEHLNGASLTLIDNSAQPVPSKRDDNDVV